MCETSRSTTLVPAANRLFASRQRYLILGFIFLLSLSVATRRSSASELNRVILRVNDRIVTLYDYQKATRERRTGITRAQIPEAERQQMLANLEVSVMRELFDENLMLSRADQLGLRADEADIRSAIERTKANFGISTEEEFDRALAGNGMTRESFRADIEKNLLVRQVMGREVYSQIAVEEEDIRRYYQQNSDEFKQPARHRLREVVVLETMQDADERLRLATELRRLILAGEADEQIESYESEGATTGWIDLGWVNVGDLDPQLEEALNGLTPGGVSEPTPARGGLHVIQMVEQEEARLRDFQDVSAEIEARLSDERFAEEMDGYMRELERNAYIESDPPPEAAGFRSGRALDRKAIDPLEAQLASQEEQAEMSTSDEQPEEHEPPN
jgi:peptidyl-prolyl cis-trans isomerase SurA